MNHTPEEWSLVKPDAVVAGSTAQARNVLEMALKDIAALSADRDHISRNRDMWKGQCERQAEQLAMTAIFTDQQIEAGAKAIAPEVWAADVSIFGHPDSLNRKGHELCKATVRAQAAACLTAAHSSQTRGAP